MINACSVVSTRALAAEGGAIRIVAGVLIMWAGTQFNDNSAGTSGNSIYIVSATVVYVLPTVDGHWISAAACVKIYNACPTACFGRCSLTTSDAACLSTLYSPQSCPWSQVR